MTERLRILILVSTCSRTWEYLGKQLSDKNGSKTYGNGNAKYQ